MVSNLWCSEKVLSIAIASFLKSLGYYLILSGDPREILLTYSKSTLVKAGVRLPQQYIQGKGVVGITAYDDRDFVLGIVSSLTLIRVLSYSSELLSPYLEILFGPPEKAVKTYEDIRTSTYGVHIKTIDVAKLYKSILTLTVLGRTKRILTERNSLVIMIVLPHVICSKEHEKTFRLCLETLEYLRNVHNFRVKTHLEILWFKPRSYTGSTVEDFELCVVRTSDEYRSSTTIRKDVGEPIVLDFVRTMGYGYGSCRNCKYATICFSS